MRAPQIESACRKPRRERLARDVLLCEAGGHERGDRVVDLGVLRRRREDRDTLVADAVTAGTLVDRRERRRVNLSAVGHGTNPAPLGRRAAQ